LTRQVFEIEISKVKLMSLWQYNDLGMEIVRSRRRSDHLDDLSMSIVARLTHRQCVGRTDQFAHLISYLALNGGIRNPSTLPSLRS